MNGSGVEGGDDLGRRIYSERQARQAQRRQGRGRLKRAFLPDDGQNKLSIDRLSIADMQRATVLAEAEEDKYDGPFQGWATFKVAVAARAGRSVVASQTQENPYHGDIVLPASVVADKGERDRHARELADASDWRERAPEPVEQTIH